MIPDASGGTDWEVAGRVWRFGQCEFDESSRELRVNNRPADVELKPLEVLCQLLLHAGEVVTREELLESVWPGLRVVDGSLATAVSKLRKALGDEDAGAILTIPRVGYRFASPVQCTSVSLPRAQELRFNAGDPVPGRDQWVLSVRLDQSGASEVWVAEHPKTHELRVFKFAADGLRLKGLKREVTLSRYIRESLGDRADFVRVFEWAFDTPPYYLECEYAGQNLAEWAGHQGGLAAIPFEARLQILVDIANAVAAAHEIGVLHKDLKPANVLVAPAAGGLWQVRVADFGSGSLTEPDRLEALGITNLGFTRTLAGHDSLTGTLMYVAPEVLAGKASTVSADVYALGVMLYQLAVGDFRRPISPGWEQEVPDPLIREDIADAACGDPSKRLASVAALLARLTNLERRRADRDEFQSATERARIAERRLAAAQARKPWMIAAVVTLVSGLAVSLGLYGRAIEARNRASRETEIAAAVNRFLAEDLLGRSNPFLSGTSGETLVEAVKQASADIDRQFPGAPEVAARLHQTIARALDNRSDWEGARREYQGAAALFEKSGGPLSQDAIAVQLQRAAMEARNYQASSVARAKSILAEQEKRIAALANPRPDLAVWLATARGMLSLIGNDAKGAATQFKAAYEQSRSLPEFDRRTRLTLKQRLAFSNIRLGDGVTAERLFRELIDEFSKIDGPDSPNILRLRMNLAQAYMIQGKHREVIRETTSIYPAYLEKLGPDHELTMQLLTTRAESEGSLELWDDAIRDNLEVYHRALKKQGAQSFYAIATLSDVALSECRAGRYGQGQADARSAYEASRKGFGPHAGLTDGTAYTVAFCLVGLDRLDEASRLLAGINAKVVAQLTGFPDWYANVDLTRARIAFKRGDLATARKYLAAAEPVFSRPDAESFQRHAVERLRAALGR